MASWLGLLVSWLLSSSPPACDTTSCPTFTLLRAGEGWELREYSPALWLTVKEVGPFDAAVWQARRPRASPGSA